LIGRAEWGGVENRPQNFFGPTFGSAIERARGDEGRFPAPRRAEKGSYPQNGPRGLLGGNVLGEGKGPAALSGGGGGWPGMGGFSGCRAFGIMGLFDPQGGVDGGTGGGYFDRPDRSSQICSGGNSHFFLRMEAGQFFAIAGRHPPRGGTPPLWNGDRDFRGHERGGGLSGDMAGDTCEKYPGGTNVSPSTDWSAREMSRRLRPRPDKKKRRLREARRGLLRGAGTERGPLVSLPQPLVRDQGIQGSGAPPQLGVGGPRPLGFPPLSGGPPLLLGFKGGEAGGPVQPGLDGGTPGVPPELFRPGGRGSIGPKPGPLWRFPGKVSTGAGPGG